MRRQPPVVGTLDERFVTGEGFSSFGAARRTAALKASLRPSIVGHLGCRPDTSNLRPAPMSHEDRRRLIEAPIDFHIVPPKSHAGTLIVRELPASGRRVPHSHADDETFAYNAGQDLDDMLRLLED